MMSKLLTRHYIFGFVALLAALILIIFKNSVLGSQMLTMAVWLLIAGIFILIFFDMLKVSLNREKTSYRSMIMERPLFNPRGKSDQLKMIYPLYPRFIAIYFDHEGDNPYDSKVHSIQAIRYEHGYLTDSLFLPLQSPADPAKGIHLTPEEASKYLKTYSKDFPLVIHNKDFGNIWLRENTNSIILVQSINTEDIARMIYPKLAEFGIEDLNDFFHFEVDEGDPVYGAKITAAIYLDYLRLHDYKSALTINPLAAESDLKPIYPGAQTLDFLNEENSEDADLLWDEAEIKYKIPILQEDPVLEFGIPQISVDDATRYIGPFTPLDEEGFPIPDRGQLISEGGDQHRQV
ncbi:MAG: hypothetical protein WAV55_08875 [Clostridiaceae bacterium]